MSAIVSPGVLPAQDDNKSKPRQSKTDLSLGEERFIRGCWHRNAAKAVRNHGGDGVKVIGCQSYCAAIRRFEMTTSLLIA
jgi:hypothetical protein